MGGLWGNCYHIHLSCCCRVLPPEESASPSIDRFHDQKLSQVWKLDKGHQKLLLGSLLNLLIIFLHVMFFIDLRKERRWREREEGKWERIEKHWSVASCTFNMQPGYVLWTGIESTTFWCIRWHCNQLSHTCQGWYLLIIYIEQTFVGIPSILPEGILHFTNHFRTPSGSGLPAATLTLPWIIITVSFLLLIVKYHHLDHISPLAITEISTMPLEHNHHWTSQ